MLPQWQFHLPTQVRFGRGGLRKLGEAAAELGAAALLVGYRENPRLEEVYARAQSALESGGVKSTPFFEVSPDPDAELAVRGARRAMEARVHLVVAVGGGSVIDAAKGIAALARLGGSVAGYDGTGGSPRPITQALPVVAVPTTAGTGSEVSSVAVFTHHGQGPSEDGPLKATIFGPALYPRLAIVDPDLAVGSPPALTAACGADALGHAIESCMCRRANPVASLLAERAVALIVDNLARAVRHPDDPEPRGPLALAATLAGAAFDSAGVTLTHAIAHALGGLLGVPHGVGVAVATPVNLRYGAERCVEVYDRLAEVCGLGGDSPGQRAGALVERVVELLRSIGLPDRVKVPPDAPADLPDRLARNAVRSTAIALKLNPRKVDESELRRIFADLLQREA